MNFEAGNTITYGDRVNSYTGVANTANSNVLESY